MEEYQGALHDSSFLLECLHEPLSGTITPTLAARGGHIPQLCLFGLLEGDNPSAMPFYRPPRRLQRDGCASTMYLSACDSPLGHQ